MKRKFADVLTIVNGKNQKKVENPKGEYPIYGSGGVMGHADAYLCEADTVVLGRKGNINNPIYVDRKFWNVDTAFGLAADRDVLLPKYLFYFCCRYDFERINKTVTIPSLTKKDLLDVEMEVPEIPEQQRIVDVLDRLHALKENRRRVLAMLDELVKARFVEMFGDPVVNPFHWAMKSFMSFGECKNGMNFHREDKGIEIHCLGVGDFHDLSVVKDVKGLPTASLTAMPSEDYLLQDGDIVFVRSNGNRALVGRCVVVYPHETPTTFSGFCIRFRQTVERKLVTRYLLQVLKADGIRAKMQGRGANIQNVNQKILSEIEIPVPPWPLQNQFAAFVREVDQTKAAVRAQVVAMETLRAKMMQDFFG